MERGREGVGSCLRFEEAGEREDQVLAVDMELARGGSAVPEVQQRPQGVLGDAERLTEVVVASVAERDVDPEERLSFAERRDPLALGRADSLDDLRHRRRRG